ncbi:MAG: tryptophan 2,3-dioxygenase family protein [Bdellovibrionota bacterium]
MKYPPVNYHDYLKLDELLSTQKRRSEEFKAPAHDEMLFIIVHQVFELWFKQIHFELNSVAEIFSKTPVAESALSIANQRLHRITSIFKLFFGQIDVLETMTPLDFLEFRDYLYPASGFQSFQFRCVEIGLGLRQDDRLQFLQSSFEAHLREDQQKLIKDITAKPSLLNLTESWLERTPFVETKEFNFWSLYEDAVRQMLKNDRQVISSNPRLAEQDKIKSMKMMDGLELGFDALLDEKKYNELKAAGHFRLSHRALRSALMIQLYRDEPIMQAPFQFISNLLDIDATMTQWRYRHALLAQRMLGSKIGTGGSSGSQYLKDAADKHKIFTDFFSLSSYLIPRSRVPALPDSVKKMMNFSSSF